MLADLEEPSAAVELAVVEARIEFAHVELQATDLDDPGARAQASAMLEQLREEREYLRDEAAYLVLRASQGGELVSRETDDRIGAYVIAGKSLGVVAAGRPMVRALLTSEDPAGARPEPLAVLLFRKTLTFLDRLQT